MSDERLILPVKPAHHRHRFLAAVLSCSAIVAVVWGFQMKTTFKKYAAAREERASQVASQSASQTRFQEAANVLKEQITSWQAQLQNEATKQQLLDKVADGMKANLEAQGTAPAPTVAGETTEVPAP